MPAPLTRDHFIELCRKSGVVEPERLDAFLAAHGMPEDPRQAAALLIREGVLTRYQAAQLLHGKYRGFILNGLKVLEQLGVGGMGAVYLCEQVTLRRKVAVKVLPQKQSQDRVARERFFREARAVAALDHPNIVRIHDCASSIDIHYILMEYVEGIDLQAKIERQGRLSVDESIGYIVQAASGLQHAHERGLVHRDVKPSNLLLDSQETIKILDLGLARFFQDPKDNLTQQLDGGAVVGTVDFLAPEQAIESSNVDVRADIYSLGATLYTLLSGKPPFGGTTTQKLINHQVKTPPPLNEIRPDVPPELNAIVQKMMAKIPSDRYQTATEVIEVLAPWVPAPTARSSSTTVNAPRSAVIARALPNAGSKSFRASGPVVPATSAKPGRQKLYVGGGIGLAVLSVVAIVMLSGGSKDSGTPLPQPKGEGNKELAKLDVPKIEVELKKEESKKEEPKKLTEPPKKRDFVAPPKEGRILAALDWSDFKPVALRYRGSQRVETRGDGSFPTDWKVMSWDNGSLVETALDKIDDQPALVQRNVEGQASNMLFTPTLRFSPRGRYEVEVEYRTGGMGVANLILFDEAQKNRTVGQLPSSRDGWRTHRFVYEGFPSEVEGRFEFHQPSAGADSWIAYRQIRVRETPTPEPNGDKSLYKIDFSQVMPFSLRYRGFNTLAANGPGRCPEEWLGGCWRGDSEGEVAIEEVGSTPMLAIRNLAGETLQFEVSRPLMRLAPGKTYRVRLSYLADSRCVADMQLRRTVGPGENNYFAGTPARNTLGLLRTIEEEFSPLPNQGYTFCFQNYSRGDKSTLYLKSFELFEVTPSTGTSIAKFDATGIQSFKSTLREQEELFRDGTGTLPLGWKATVLRAKSVGNFTSEKVGGRNALSFELNEGQPGLQLQTTSPVGTIQAGRTYELRVNYVAAKNRKTSVRLIAAPNNADIDKLELLPTDGQWRQASLRFLAVSDQPFHIQVLHGGKPEDGKISIGSVEVLDVSR